MDEDHRSVCHYSACRSPKDVTQHRTRGSPALRSTKHTSARPKNITKSCSCRICNCKYELRAVGIGGIIIGKIFETSKPKPNATTELNRSHSPGPTVSPWIMQIRSVELCTARLIDISQMFALRLLVSFGQPPEQRPEVRCLHPHSSCENRCKFVPSRLSRKFSLFAHFVIPRLISSSFIDICRRWLAMVVRPTTIYKYI